MSEQGEATAKLATCPHCGELHAEDQLRCSKTDLLLPLEGRRLDGKFRFVSSLGSGGMASVWLARNERVDRDVAIKFLRPEVGRDPESVARFRSEARAAGRIGNKHICEILDLGDSPIGPYIVMERLRGLDLAALIRRQGRLAPGYAVRIVRHALEGLAAAHAAGIVHRDLKPGNVFLHRTDEGDTQVKLMDFGVSKFLDGTGDALTASGILLGTPEYMAPEQLEGANKLGPPADIFAIGAILYRSITGQLVFSGSNLAAVLRSMAIDTPTPVDELIEGLPPELVAVIQRCLERDPAARFASAGALSDALAPFEQFEGEVRSLVPAARIDSAALAAADSSISDSAPSLSPSAVIEIEPEPGSTPEPEPGPGESIESETKKWTQDASGPLRNRELEQAPTATAMPTPTPSEPPKPRAALWPWLTLATLVVVLLVFAGREWQWAGDSAAADSGKSQAANAETGVGAGELDPAIATDASSESGLVESSGSTSETSGTGEPGTGETEAGETEAGETEAGETSDPEADAALDDPALVISEGPSDGVSTDRPAPPGTVRGGGYIAPTESGPVSDHAAARKYCEGLANRRVAGISRWRLANPTEANAFIGSKIKSSRYWTTAIWHSKSRVYQLPKGKKTSEKIDKRIARPLCVARY